jgi:membrane protein
MQLRTWKERLFAKDASELRGLGGACARFLRFALLVGSEFHRNLCLERAATLAFATILSLIPFAVLFFSFAGLIGKGDLIINYVKQEIFPRVAPDFQEELSQWLEQYISKEAFQQSLAGVVGFIALVGLIFAALGALHTAERNFNRIWRARSSRSYLEKFTAFWVILTVSPFVLVASTWLQEWLASEQGVKRLTSESLLLQGLYDFVVPVGLGFLAFTVLHIFLPATRVRIPSAALGGLVSAALWEASRQTFFIYVERTENLYGQIAIVPLFLVWLYVNWLFILLGCVVAYVRQNLPTVLKSRQAAGGREELPAAFVGLFLLEEAGRAFEKGRALATPEAIALRLGVDSAAVEEAARRLVEGGVLARTLEPPGAYALGRSPREIELSAVAALLQAPDVPDAAPGEDPVGSGGGGPGGGAPGRSAAAGLLREARAAWSGAFRGRTLADLLALGREEAGGGAAAARRDPGASPAGPSGASGARTA